MTTQSDFDVLAEPDDATVERAIEEYARIVRREYGDRLKGIYLFGSRARGDHGPESDADIVVILANDGWEYWHEKGHLTDLTYDFLIATGADLQAWPIAEDEWLNPNAHRNPSLVEEMHRDARKIGTGS